jgi:hypothetical protein
MMMPLYGGARKAMKKNLKVIIFYAVLILIIIVAASSLFKDVYTEAEHYSEILDYFRGEKVHAFVVTPDNQVQLELYTDEAEKYAVVVYDLRDVSIFYNDLNDLII